MYPKNNKKRMDEIKSDLINNFIFQFPRTLPHPTNL